MPVLALAIGWPVAVRLCGLDSSGGLRFWASGAAETWRLVAAALLVSWPIFGVLQALDAPSATTGALVAAALAAGFGGVTRSIVRLRAHRAAALRERTLVIGSGEVARRLVEKMRRHPELGLDPVGFVDDDAHRADELEIPYLGAVSTIDELIGSAQVDRAVIAFSRGSHDQLLDCVRACRTAQLPIDIVPRLFELLDGPRALEQIGGMPVVSLEPPTLSVAASISKRALDVIATSIALVALSPLLLVIALAIRLDSPGPVLFRQERSGRSGKFFTLYKFRSMEGAGAVFVQTNGAIVKGADDKRLTRVGRVIRRYSLDEVPQFLNVLKGDMSLVGPRPLVRAEFAALTEEWQSRRGDVRPGLTGLWQISGRSHIGFEDMISFDYQYAVGWSLRRDIEILFATVPVVLSGRGAY